jgi:hypothetical protein
MPDSLPELEAQRSKILRQFTTLGDFRPGSICAVPRRCGKPTCHCAKPNDPGHNPQLRLTRKVDGKTVAESFPSPAAFRKAQAEIDEYHHFQKLTMELVGVNERICRLRPVESESSTWTAEEKTVCCDPSGGRAGNRHSAQRDLRRAAQNRRAGPGSRGDGPPNCAACSGGRWLERAVGAAPRRKSSWVTAPSGSGTSARNSSPARSRSWISTMPGNTGGTWAPSSILAFVPVRKQPYIYQPDSKYL